MMGEIMETSSFLGPAARVRLAGRRTWGYCWYGYDGYLVGSRGNTRWLFLLLKDRPFTFCLFLFVGLSLVDDGKGKGVFQNFKREKKEKSLLLPHH